MILQVGKHNLLLGLEWQIESSGKGKSRTQEVSGGRKCARIRLPSKQVLVGVRTDSSSIPAKSIPGALAIALAYRECLVCHEIPGTELVWLCAITDGAPIPGFDEVLSQEIYRQRAAEVMTYYPNAQIVGNIPGAVARLEDVIATVPPKKLAALRIRSPYFKLIVLLNVASAIIALLVAGNSYIEKQKEIEAERLRMQAEAEMAQMSSMESSRMQAQEVAYFDKFKKEVEEARASVSMYSNPVKYINQWVRIYESLPDMRGSFLLHSFSCDLDKCHIGWIGASPWSDPSIFDGDNTVTMGIRKVTGESEAYNENLKGFTQKISFSPVERLHFPQGLTYESVARKISDVKHKFDDALKTIGVISIEVQPEASDIIVNPPEEIAAKAQPVTIARGSRIKIATNNGSYAGIIDFFNEVNSPIHIEAMGISGLSYPQQNIVVAGIIRIPSLAGENK